jgi:ubiquinone/menaquinone biosynthesis C-methylase UbiE
VKIDIGCGPNPAEGFEGVDQYPFDGKVKHVLDVRKAPWPFESGSVDEARASHFVEHLTGRERCVFVNELYRVLKPGASATIITPHWASNRAYGDPTHEWPPVSEMWFYYLSREWRMQNAPHTDSTVWPGGYSCDFEATWGYSLREDLKIRNQEYQQFAITNYKEAAQDIMANLKARKG